MGEVVTNAYNAPVRTRMSTLRAAGACCVLATPTAPAMATTCALEPGSTQVVTRVEASGALTLDDGREVVLIGALLPASPESSNIQYGALKALVEGQPVELAFAGRRLDRYGRLLAHVFVVLNNHRVWVQGRLVETGHARAYGLPGHTACLDELITREQQARQRPSALWGQPQFQDRDATDTRTLLRYRDTFQTVVGRVETVTKVRGETVLIFSAEGLAGFNVTIARTTPASKTSFQSWNDLKHKTVRVRGWIDQRRGPSITLNDTREIEQLDQELESQSSEPALPLPIPVVAPAP
jgi:micrococcal nuclease